MLPSFIHSFIYSFTHSCSLADAWLLGLRCVQGTGDTSRATWDSTLGGRSQDWGPDQQAQRKVRATRAPVEDCGRTQQGKSERASGRRCCLALQARDGGSFRELCGKGPEACGPPRTPRVRTRALCDGCRPMRMWCSGKTGSSLSQPPNGGWPAAACSPTVLEGWRP